MIDPSKVLTKREDCCNIKQGKCLSDTVRLRPRWCGRGVGNFYVLWEKMSQIHRDYLEHTKQKKLTEQKAIPASTWLFGQEEVRKYKGTLRE